MPLFDPSLLFALLIGVSGDAVLDGTRIPDTPYPVFSADRHTLNRVLSVRCPSRLFRTPCKQRTYALLNIVTPHGDPTSFETYWRVK